MRISIPQPCSEDWNKMTPSERGAFCQVCNKDVFDFTNKTAPEIRDILLERSSLGKQSCGRILRHQMQEVNALGFEFASAKQEVQTAWIITLIAVFGLTLFSCQNTVSKEMVEQMNLQTATLLSDTLIAEIPEASDSITPTDSLTPYVIDWPWEWEKFVIELPFTTGVMVAEPKALKLEECIFFMGDIAVSGFITGSITSAPREPISEAFLPFGMNTLPRPTAAQEFSPLPFRSGHVPSSPVNLDNSEFSADIDPLPLSSESQLVIQAHVDILLKCQITDAEAKQYFEATTTLSQATYRLPLPFAQLPVGMYQLYLESALSRKIIEFRISRKAPDRTA